jgi:hypothetical protein
LKIRIFFLFVAIQRERKRLQKKADCRLRANVASLCEKHKNLRRRPVKRRQPSREKREQNAKASGLSWILTTRKSVILLVWTCWVRFAHTAHLSKSATAPNPVFDFCTLCKSTI